MKIIIIGGGAAGFFAALAAKEKNPAAEVLLLEKTAKLLSKVRISGGGRCNATHACFDPKQLIQNYPRGSKELLGPFYRFQPKDTIVWFKKRGVELKKEEDGRMFPITDSSETIIHCFLGEAKRLGVEIRTLFKIDKLEMRGEQFKLNEELTADRLILATGSSRFGWDTARSFGHTIQPPVPSLFTFNIPSFPLVDLSGVSVENVKLRLEGEKLEQEGPLLITHWGFSGPAALKLSAKGARLLAEKQYKIPLLIDWLPKCSLEDLRQELETQKKIHPGKQLGSLRFPPLPKSLWKELCQRTGLSNQAQLNSLSKSAIIKLSESLKRDRYQVCGKTTNKEEFVTCGGITLSEVDFKMMQSKLCKHLYFCGEILDIDGVTGGFNFQNAWTTGFIAGEHAGSHPGRP